MHGRRAVSVMPRSSAYESSQDNYAMDDSINRAEYFSNAVLEDTYNQALSSRGRDDDLLRSANATIAYNIEHRPLAPRSSIVTRRMRASSVPPRQVRAPRRSVQAPRRVHYSYPKEGVYYSPTIDTQGLTASRPPIGNIQQPRQYYRLATAATLLSSRTYRPFTPSIYDRPAVRGSLVPLRSVNRSQAIRRSVSLPPVHYASYSTTTPIYRSQSIRRTEIGRPPRIMFPNLSIKPGLANGGAASGGAVGTLPKYYACGGDPMHPPVSELRRKLRRTICQSKGIPNYYRLKDMKDE